MTGFLLGLGAGLVVGAALIRWAHVRQERRYLRRLTVYPGTVRLAHGAVEVRVLSPTTMTAAQIEVLGLGHVSFRRTRHPTRDRLTT